MTKKTAIISILIILILLANTTVQSATSQDPVEVGFYINDETEGVFVDFYELLNNKHIYDQMITDVGLEKVVFVHQSGKGADLSTILNRDEGSSLENILRVLNQTDFLNSYIDAGNRQTLYPRVGLHLDKMIASNGSIELRFRGSYEEISLLPSELEVKRSLNNSDLETISISNEDITWDSTVKKVIIATELLQPTNEEQLVYYTVSYKDKKASDSFILHQDGNIENTGKYNIDLKLKKEIVRIGEQAIIEGSLFLGNLPMPYKNISITINKKTGHQPLDYSVVTDSDGLLNLSLDVTDEFDVGEYIVYAKLGELVTSNSLLLNIQERLPEVTFISDTISLVPNYYYLPEQSSEYIDVLVREYPEFLDKLKEGWPDNGDTDSLKNDKINSLLIDVDIEVRSQGNITESNFNRIMKDALLKTILKPKHRDIYKALLASYGEEINYTDTHKELHPNLIPLRETIKDNVLKSSVVFFYDISRGTLMSGPSVLEKLKENIIVEGQNTTSVSYRIEDNENILIDNGRGILFNKSFSYPQQATIYVDRVNSIDLTDKTIILEVESYGNDIEPTGSTLADYNQHTRKIKITDENGEPIVGEVEDIFLYESSTGFIAKQAIKPGQKIDSITISRSNINSGEYTLFFKIYSSKWYKIEFTLDENFSIININ